VLHRVRHLVGWLVRV